MVRTLEFESLILSATCSSRTELWIRAAASRLVLQRSKRVDQSATGIHSPVSGLEPEAGKFLNLTGSGYLPILCGLLPNLVAKMTGL